MKAMYIIAGIIAFMFFLSAKTKSEEARLRGEGLMPMEGAETMEHVTALLEKGYKIQAIKVYRRIHNVGLKEAKEAVEKLQIGKQG